MLWLMCIASLFGIEGSYTEKQDIMAAYHVFLHERLQELDQQRRQLDAGQQLIESQQRSNQREKDLVMAEIKVLEARENLDRTLPK